MAHRTHRRGSAGRGPSGRVRKVARVLAEDPWRKLAALILAALVWWWLFSHTEDRHSVTLELSTETAAGREYPPGKVSVRAPPGRYLVTSFRPPGEPEDPLHLVQVNIAGHRNQVDAIRRRGTMGIGLVVDADADDLRAGRVDITVGRLRSDDRDLDRMLVGMVPPRIEARVAPVGSQLFTLEPARVDFLLPEDPRQRERVLWDRTLFVPGFVTLTGPRQILEAIRDDRSRRILRADVRQADLEATDPESRVSVRLELLPDLAEERVRLQERNPEARVLVRRRVREFEVRITPRMDFPAGSAGEDGFQPLLPVPVSLHVFDPELAALLSREERQVEDFVRDHCRLLVNMAGYEPATGAAPARFVIHSYGGRDFLEGQHYDVRIPPLPLPVRAGPAVRNGGNR